MSRKEKNVIEPLQPASLSISLFGPFHLTIAGQTVAAPRARAAGWILALLILRRGQPVDRDWLAATLWPDAAESSALFNLRRNLSELRKMLGAEARRVESPTPRTLVFNLDGVECDLLHFKTLISRNSAGSLQEAVRIYRGEFLEGCREAWVLPERVRYEETYFAALETLAGGAMAQRKPDEAVKWLRQLVAQAPLRESAQRLLLQALAHLGDHAAITESFQRFRRHLHSEINTAPAPETIALYESLQKEQKETRPISARKASTDSAFAPPPYSLSALIGRESDIAALLKCLQTTRLLTLTGAGGIGKTRLAAAVGEHFGAEEEKTAWVELAPLLEAAQIPFAIAAALRLSERPGEPIAQRLTDFVGAQKLLLILDNCEHLRDGCAEWGALLLKSCPNLRLLATSRQPLRLFGETNWRVPSLPLPLLIPNNAAQETEESLLQFGAAPAIRLFTERAKAAQHTFRLTRENAADIAHICAELDGIPLALELAAVWVGSLSVSQIARRLNNQFALLQRGDRVVSPRHQKLRNTMDWSYKLLQSDEQRLLARLAVFAGGWTLEEAEAICSEKLNEPVLFSLSQLVEKSLTETMESKGLLRYRLLEPVRQYAQERLVETGEAAAMQRRHLRFFLERSECVTPALGRVETAGLLDAMVTDYPNYRKALRFCFFETSDATDEEIIVLGLRLSIALSVYQTFRGLFEEGREMLETALRHSGACSHPDLRAKAQLSLGQLLYRRGEIDAAMALLHTAVNYYREQSPSGEQATALRILGVTYFTKDDYPKTKALLEEGLTLCEEIGEQTEMLRIQVTLGILAKATGDYPKAQRLMETAILHFQVEGWLADEGLAQHNLGNALREGGDGEASRAHYERSLQIHQQMENRAWMGINLLELARLEFDNEDWEAAHRLGLEALSLCHAGNRSIEPQCLALLAAITRRMGNLIAARDYQARAIIIQQRLGQKRDLTYSLWGMTHQLQEEGQPTRGVQLLTAFIQIREQSNIAFTPGDLTAIAENLQELQNALGEAAFAEAQAAGRIISLEEAVVFALEAQAT